MSGSSGSEFEMDAGSETPDVRPARRPRDPRRRRWTIAAILLVVLAAALVVVTNRQEGDQRAIGAVADHIPWTGEALAFGQGICGSWYIAQNQLRPMTEPTGIKARALLGGTHPVALDIDSGIATYIDPDLATGEFISAWTAYADGVLATVSNCDGVDRVVDLDRSTFMTKASQPAGADQSVVGVVGDGTRAWIVHGDPKTTERTFQPVGGAPTLPPVTGTVLGVAGGVVVQLPPEQHGEVRLVSQAPGGPVRTRVLTPAAGPASLRGTTLLAPSPDCAAETKPTCSSRLFDVTKGGDAFGVITGTVDLGGAATGLSMLVGVPDGPLIDDGVALGLSFVRLRNGYLDIIGIPDVQVTKDWTSAAVTADGKWLVLVVTTFEGWRLALWRDGYSRPAVAKYGVYNGNDVPIPLLLV